MKPWETPSLHSKVVALALSVCLGQQNDCSAPNPYKNQDPAANTQGKVNRTSSYWWKRFIPSPAGVASSTLQRHLLPFPDAGPLLLACSRKALAWPSPFTPLEQQNPKSPTLLRDLRQTLALHSSQKASSFTPALKDALEPYLPFPNLSTFK